jgi:hypothetical protein
MHLLLVLLSFFGATLLFSHEANSQNKGKGGSKSPEDAEYGVTYSTRMDFDSAMVEGQMKAPSGFYLEGRNKQRLSNMVNLRSNFKQELRNSRSGVKAVVH